MEKVIGIISYLPDDEKVRKARKELLSKLINKCDYLFDIPIFIIAQNWRKADENDICSINCLLYKYNKPLGIVGARNELRNKFLNSSYDYLIMLDDDSIISGEDGSKYLKQIDENPNCFIEFNKTRLKLFAISREIFQKEIFDDINPEDEGGFEDRIFVNKLRVKYPESRKFFNETGISENSIATKDTYSTWYKNQNINKMLNNTLEAIDNIKK